MLLNYFKRIIVLNPKDGEIKNLIASLKQTNPFIEGNIFKSVENVNLRTIIAYKEDGVKHHFLEHYDEWK